jgi:endonuclease-3 related protein
MMNGLKLFPWGPWVDHRERVLEVLRILNGLRGLLEESGWLIAPPASPRWWGGAESGDEVVISAMLVQRTRWEAVSSALSRLRGLALNSLARIAEADPGHLSELIRGVNYRFVKARRLVKLAGAVVGRGGLDELRSDPRVRDFLLSQEGVGEETADSILLFALNIPTVPMSQYTRRVMSRVLGVESNLRALIEEALPDLHSHKLMHAGVVTIGKRYCLTKPLCGQCPLMRACVHGLARSFGLP